MKLTKGKISKLYNKKNQSFKKKINRKKGASKRKTFRKNKKYNLAKKTLKRFYSKKRGGQGLNEDPKLVVTPVTPTDAKEIPDNPFTTDVKEIPDNPFTTDVKEIPGNPFTTDAKEIPGNPFTTDAKEIPVTGEDVTVTKVDVNALPDTSIATEGLTVPGSPPPPTFENSSFLQDEQKEQINISDPQQQISSEATSQDEGNIDRSLKSEEEISNSGIISSQDNVSSVSEPNNKLTEALSTIVDVLSEKVEAEVANKVGYGSSGKNVQDGFISVATAAENMSGGKKRKSRKFRLTNKGKSRKHQK
jgi:hypothetical protein